MNHSHFSGHNLKVLDKKFRIHVDVKIKADYDSQNAWEGCVMLWILTAHRTPGFVMDEFSSVTGLLSNAMLVTSRISYCIVWGRGRRLLSYSF